MIPQEISELIDYNNSESLNPIQNELELCYWRKIGSIADGIQAILLEGTDKKLEVEDIGFEQEINLKQLDKIIDLLVKHLKEYDLFYSQIWDFKECLDLIAKNIVVLSYFKWYLETYGHNDMIYFYDSY